MEDNLPEINIDTTNIQLTTQTTTVQTEIKTEVKTEVKTETKTVKSEFPPYLYVLSDNVGYVGSYYSISDIEEIVSAYHLITSFMVQCFKTSKAADLFTVWVVLYKDIDAVAFVSNNRMDAVKVHSTLMQMGLAYEDCIDYWKQTVGLSPSAKERLDRIHTIKDKKLLDDSYNIFIQKLDLSTENIPNGPIEQLMNETQKITIMDAIIPTLIKGAECIDDIENDIENTIENNIENNIEETNIATDKNGVDVKKLTMDELEVKEKELIQRIIKQNQQGLSFCNKCEEFVNEFYNSNNDTLELFTQRLKTFVGQYCYSCSRAIRNEFRKENQKKIERKITAPIESPFISASVNNKENVDESKLEEVIKNLSELIKTPDGEKLDFSKLDLDIPANDLDTAEGDSMAAADSKYLHI